MKIPLFINYIGGIILMLIIVIAFQGCTNGQKKKLEPDPQDSLKIQIQNIVTNPEKKDLLAISVFQPEDSIIVNKILQQYKNVEPGGNPINKIAIDVAREFLGTTYIPHTLETKGEEKLVVNLRAFDCTTYLENVIVLARLIQKKKTFSNDFLNELKLIRYRKGKLNDYPSRLHYFSDWLNDNENKGVLTDITKQLEGEEYLKEINFMTRNRDIYSQLTNDDYFTEMEKIEQQISSTKHYYIPKEKVMEIEDSIQDGDLIAITSTIDGLDIAHVALAIQVNNRLHIIHASSTSGKVVISKEPLSVYLEKHNSQSGIMVGRLSGILNVN